MKANSEPKRKAGKLQNPSVVTASKSPNTPGPSKTFTNDSSLKMVKKIPNSASNKKNSAAKIQARESGPQETIKNDSSLKTVKRTPNSTSNKKTSISKIQAKSPASWWLAPKDDSGAPTLRITSEESWHINSGNVQPLDEPEKLGRLTADLSKLPQIVTSVEASFDLEVLIYQKSKGSKMSGDQKWINDVLKSGTTSDKIAALALVVQESPVHELSALDTLIGMAGKKEYRTSQLALEALKDLLIHNLLPDRRLIPFRSQPLNHPSITMQHAMLFWYEDLLLQRMELILSALDNGLKSTVEYFKKQCMDIAAELLMGKPEKEGRFLAMVVNKLGDPSGAVGSKCIELLRTIVRKHPAMKCVVVREVRQLIYRPNLSVRVVHSGIIFLSQVTLVKGDHDVAAQLVECYMSLFEKAVTQDELGSRLLSSLLSGLDRAFPFLNNTEPISKHVDSLFRIIHSASFSTSTRALMLISHIALANTSGDALAESSTKSGKAVHTVSEDETHLVSRFYRSLYSKLLSPQISTRAYNTLFLNLLFRSMKRDPSDLRVMAYLKRLGICALQSSAPIAAGLLFLMSETYRARPKLLAMMTQEEGLVAHKGYADSVGAGNEARDKEDQEGGAASHQLGNFEASKREPAFAASGTPALWEASLLKHHFHPSVKSFSSSMLESPHMITFAGDPTVEFSLTAFLNRFAYKNPKKQHSDKIRRPQATGEEPLNTATFMQSSTSDIAPDKLFFHKFFGEKEKLRVEGKSRDRAKRKKVDDDDEDGGSIGSDDEVDFDERAIDKFATKLAEDMMRDNDDLVDIDDDFSDSGGEDGSDMDGDGDDVSESDALDFEEFKQKGKISKDSSSKKGVKAKKSVPDDESDDGYDLTAYGDDEDDSNMGDDDDDDSVNSDSDDMEDDEVGDDLDLAFADEPSMSMSRRQGAKVKSGKGSRKSGGDMSDFASAEDYEDTMEEIVGRYTGKDVAQTGISLESSSDRNMQKAPKRNRDNNASSVIEKHPGDAKKVPAKKLRTK